MRYAALFAPLLLCGCVTDTGSGFLASLAAIPTALKAQDTLEVDLIKDLARKSLELEFISNHTYSCGDPNDRFIIEAMLDYNTLNARFLALNKNKKGFDLIAETIKKERDKIAVLKTVANYAETIKKIADGFKIEKQLVDALKAELPTLKSLDPTGQSGPVFTAFGAVLTIISRGQDLAQAAVIYKAALAMRPGLEAAAKQMKTVHFLADLTRREAVAFRYWDGCARERLAFIRDYYLPVYKPRPKDMVSRTGHMRFQGMERTPVLEFAREYRQYLMDREAFIGKRPNYVSVIDAVIKANNDILTALTSEQAITAGKGMFDFLTGSIPDVKTIQATKL